MLRPVASAGLVFESKSCGRRLLSHWICWSGLELLGYFIPFNDDFDTAIVKYASFLAWSSIDGKQQTAGSELDEYNNNIKDCK